MKKYCAAVLISLYALQVAALVTLKKDPVYRDARRNGAQMKIELHIQDDDGTPVPDAKIKAYLGMNFRPLGTWIDGTTDTNGVFVLEGKTCGDEIEIFVSKNGYYKTFQRLCFAAMGHEHDVKDGKWLPYGETRHLLLRKIHNPSELCKFGFGNGREIPDTNIWVGVDMQQGDFVRPYGTGLRKDFELLVDWDGKPPISSGRCTAVMRFNGQFEGAYLSARADESEYPYVYEANKDNSYSVVKAFTDKRQKTGQFSGGVLFGRDTVLVTRTRAIIDADKRLSSACYGYIHAFDVDASWDGNPTIRLSGVFNPTPNDTNLEPKIDHAR